MPQTRRSFSVGRVVARPCSISASGSGTQVSGQAILAAGSFTVTLKNNTTGLTSGGTSLTVSSPTAAPVISQITTSPNPPVNRTGIHDHADGIELRRLELDGLFQWAGL